MRGRPGFGPLEPYATGFRDFLVWAGYSPSTISARLRLLTDLGRWMNNRGLDAASLTPLVADEFLAYLDQCARGCLSSRPGMRQLLAWLGDQRLVPSVSQTTSQMMASATMSAPVGTAEVVLARYSEFLDRERGLTAPSIERMVGLTRPFLVWLASPCGEVDLDGLSAARVGAFMHEQCQTRSPAHVRMLATALRSFLKYLHVIGATPILLAAAIPAAARRHADLPRDLEPAQVDTLMAACDITTVAGRRNRAIILLLRRLALRCGEVAALTLDDIDWRHGEITVRGKHNRVERLPLPADVGEAIAAYLHDGRPAAALDRHVFIRLHAPHRGMTNVTVTMAVAQVAEKAGLGKVHAHRLRHCAATATLRSGASLAEVGQLLRHTSAITTAGYAKVDIAALAALARPWPIYSPLSEQDAR